MPLRPVCRRFFLVLLILGAALPALAAEMPKLGAPPLGERWFSISMDGERVGFAHLKIGKTDDGYRIDSDASVKMRVMGFSRESTTKESSLVGPDLSLRSFQGESRIDGSPFALKGEVTRQGIRVATESGGRKKERTIKTRGAVYPSQALNLYPLLQGTTTGKRYQVATLDMDNGKLKQVQIEVIGPETLPSGRAVVHLKNDLYPVDNDIWVDLEGNSLKESVRDDLVVTESEDERSARLYLANAALAKRDLVLDFSLIRVEPPIARTQQLKMLSVEFTGIPATLPLLQEKGQKGVRLADGRVIFTMPNPAFVLEKGDTPATRYLEPAERIPSDSPEIIAQKSATVGGEQNAAQAAKRLLEWVAKEIKGTVIDSQSPLETLKIRNGNCQSHARLYAALARAAGIPTRFVSGLIYAPGQGYLYHSWAESYLDGWVAVDPTFGEIPADITHIKIMEGESADEMGYLAGMVGRVKAKVIEKGY